MVNPDYDLVCIGSGPAGQKAAIQAAKLGKRVAVVEKRHCIGGACVETGTIPSKTLREAIRSLKGVLAHDDGLGFAPKTKPTIESLLGHVGSVIARENDVTQNQLQRNDVNIIIGKASFAGPTTIRVDSADGVRDISSRNTLIAVGTTPATPPGIQPDGKAVIVSDGILTLRRVPKTLVVVGAGVIGIEYASMFAALGIDVTVVDQRDRPLEFLDREIVDDLLYQMRGNGVTFRLGEAVASVDVSDESDHQGLVELESGKHLVADLILFSVGRKGATDALNLSAAGLEADKRGRLTVNDHLQTTTPNIYAAGDVIGFPSLAATSSEQGRIAASHMFGLEPEPMASHFPIGIYALPEISYVGQTEQELTQKKVPYEVGIARYREIARGQILGDDSGLFKILVHSKTQALLGVHIIGTGATELIHTGQAVLALKGGLNYFLTTVFNYPTLAECYKVAALDASNKIRRAEEIRQQRAKSEA